MQTLINDHECISFEECSWAIQCNNLTETKASLQSSPGLSGINVMVIISRNIWKPVQHIVVVGAMLQNKIGERDDMGIRLGNLW